MVTAAPTRRRPRSRILADAARDAQVIETGYDGRERYRLNARVIRQQTENGQIDLEQLEMNYHPGAQGDVPGEHPANEATAMETWHLLSDRGQVRAGGDDVQLDGNVRVTDPPPGRTCPWYSRRKVCASILPRNSSRPTRP